MISLHPLSPSPELISSTSTEPTELRQHTTVLLDEAVDALLGGADTLAAGTWIDATFGRGGHSRLILSRLGAQGRLVAFDKDLEAIAAAAQIDDARFSIRHEGFRHLADLPSASAARTAQPFSLRWEQPVNWHCPR